MGGEKVDGWAVSTNGGCHQCGELGLGEGKVL